MSNDKALEAALDAYWEADPGPTDTSYREAMQAAISAYLSALTGEAQVVEDFIRKLRDFDKAYDEEIFAPLTEAEKAKVGGELRSRIAAEMGRHLAKFFVQAAASLQTMQARVEAAEEAENETKDAFWAIYPKYLEMGGAPVSTETARTHLAARVKELEEALQLAKDTIKVWHGPNAWEIYDRASPEMATINAAIKGGSNG